MTKTWLRLVFAVSGIALLGTGCEGCRPAQVGNAKGQIRFIFDDNGVSTVGESGLYDFGAVPMGKTVKMNVSITNTGRGTMTVRSFDKVSGDPVQLGANVIEANPVFLLAYDNTDVAVGETKDFELSFASPEDTTQKQVAHESVLTVSVDNADPATAQLTVRGTSVSGECEIPKTLDFGAVARGDTFDRDVNLHNTRPIDTMAFSGDIASPQGETVFAYTSASPRGDFAVLSNQTKTVTFAFTPTEARDYFASVTMRAADGCPDVRVQLIGTGVDQVLTWSPAVVDFGYITPPLSVNADVTFQNRAIRPVVLSNLQTVEGGTTSTVFKVIAADPNNLTQLTIPASTRDATGTIIPGTAVASMSFKPTLLGPRTANLKAATDLHNPANIAVPLKGFGGGPNIVVRPSPDLGFGRVAYFAGANPLAFASKRLTIINAGTRPTPPDPRANLKLGAGGAGKPYFDWVPKNANTSRDELCLGVFDTGTNTCSEDLPTTGPGSYNPAVGIEASGALANLDVPVRVTPNSLGVKEWEVTIYSNDPDEPEAKLTVTAEAVMLSPCDYTVTPLNLNFGVVSPPNNKDLGFTIKNNNPADICLLSNLDMNSGSDPMFSLPAGPVASVELQPAGQAGDTYNVLVRAWPQGQLPATPTFPAGQVVFNMSNPSKPQALVNLTATLAPSCLTITPNSLDFGTVKKDCNSADRSFQVYNTCPTAVTLQSFSMVAAAGEPPGGPNCSGSVACPEFFTVSTGGIAPGTVLNPPSATSSPVSFSLKYHPIDYGADTGAFLIRALQGGQPVDYVITLKGVGDTQGLNTDTFRQDAQPKADILLVIDNSCSMSDKQAALGTNFASFMQYAVASQVDFQIGVTITELTDPNYGMLCPMASCPSSIGNTQKILRPTTPSLPTVFADLVNVGTPGGTESCLEPATKALTSPFITDPTKNLGFLRNDAVLAVVCVTDALDQAPQPTNYYLNQLLNVKGSARPGAFTYNVVGPFQPTDNPPACTYDSGVGDDGRHTYMVTQTNGVKEEICTPNWGIALQNIGKSAFGFRTNFYLTARPDQTAMPIAVAIDGVPLAQTDTNGARVWSYDGTNNSINFEPLYVPEAGKTMTVTYQVACIP